MNINYRAGFDFGDGVGDWCRRHLYAAGNLQYQ